MVPGRERASRTASDCGKVKDNSLEAGCNNSRLHPRGGRKDLRNANASTVGDYVLRKNTVFNYGKAFYSYSLNMLLQVARGLDAAVGEANTWSATGEGAWLRFENPRGAEIIGSLVDGLSEGFYATEASEFLSHGASWKKVVNLREERKVHVAMIAGLQKDVENFQRGNSEEGKELPGDNDVFETLRELPEKKTHEL